MIERFSHKVEQGQKCKCWSNAPVGFDETKHFVRCPVCSEIFLRLGIHERDADNELMTGMYAKDKVSGILISGKDCMNY